MPCFLSNHQHTFSALLKSLIMVNTKPDLERGLLTRFNRRNLIFFNRKIQIIVLSSVKRMTNVRSTSIITVLHQVKKNTEKKPHQTWLHISLFETSPNLYNFSLHLRDRLKYRLEHCYNHLSANEYMSRLPVYTTYIYSMLNMGNVLPRCKSS